jgi:crotonobetainyl-CoA:carnitine CoA-transferase CaiB-like acyl-CoA transferase
VTAGALDGIRVIEVGVVMAAPFAALQLADLGADVIKIESPEGEPVRVSGDLIKGESSTFMRLNRLKRSVVLDLKSPGGK